jgi:predicted XRE-type DNA-binding protein
MSIQDVKSDSTEVEANDYSNWLDGSVLGSFFNYRLNNNRDAKVIITSRSSSTGLGKTTLAILLCKYVDRNGWDAENKSMLDVNEYINRYLDTKEGSALLLDEIEHGADNRRAMSHANVNLSKAWATLRYRNVVTFSTLPTINMLDSRMMELADLWINVMSRGVAMPHFIWINDYTGELRRVPARHPETGELELLTWKPIDDDEDFKILEKKKDKSVFGKTQKSYTHDEVKKAKEKAARQKRNELIETLYEKTNLSQRDIGELVGLKQQAVSQIILDN